MYRIKKEFFRKGEFEKTLKGLTVLAYVHEERLYPDEYEKLSREAKQLFEAVDAKDKFS